MSDTSNRPPAGKVKQVIAIRKDLRQRMGKILAQGAHASMAFMSTRLASSRDSGIIPFFTEEEWEWIDDSFTKIGVYVDSEQELFDLREKAVAAGLTVHAIQDNGRTEFHGVPTWTALAVGPHYVDKFTGITDHLPLL